MDQDEELSPESGKLKYYFETAEDYSVCMLDPSGKIVSCNEGTERIKGYKSGEIIDKSYSIFYTEEDIHLKKPQKALETALKEGYYQDEGWRVKSDGSRVWASIIITPLYDNKRQLLGFSKITRNLSKRRKAVQALIESEERYRLLVSGVKDYAIFMLDKEGNIISWNSGAERIKGYKFEEVAGRHFSLFYTEEDLRDGKPARELKIAKEKGKYEEEGWRIKKDGSRFWANVVITAIFDDERNELIGFSKVTRDLTEKKRAEETYRLMVENVEDYGIFMLNPDGTVATWNAGAQKIKQYTEREIIGKHFSIFYPEEDIKKGKPEIELKVASETGRFEDEGWRLRKDGTRFWANVIVTAVYDDNKKLIGFSKISRDLTERKQAEQRFRLLVESVKDYGIFMLDPNGIVSSWNAGAESIKGYRAEEIIGKHFSIFYPEEDIKRGKTEMELREAIKHGRFEDEDWRIKKDGSRFWANVIITPVYDDNRHLLGFSKVTRDLTDRKEIEEALKKANEKKDEFIGVASHELKTPLTSLKAYIQLLQREINGNPTANGIIYIQKASGYIEKLSSLISDLLDVSKIQAGKLEFNIREIDFEKTITEAIDNLKHTAHTHKIIVDNRLTEPVIIRADRDRIEQVINNLLSNAIKYSPKADKVEVKLSKTNKAVQVAVTDYGFGIPEENQKRIFERFFRVEGQGSFISGLGIGLFITCQIVSRHNGKIWVESQEGKGSTFYVTLPIESK